MKKLHVVPLAGAIAAMAAFSGAALAAKAPETIMRANCGSCHGQKGEGGTSWIDTSQRAFNIAGRSKSSIVRWTRDGRRPEMPSFPVQEINDAELSALATYVNALPGSYIAEPTAQYTVTIKDEDPWYYPMQLTVNQGQTVKFINMGKTYHPVTQLEFVATEGASGTDSGQLGSTRSSTLYAVYYRQFNEPVGTKLTFLCKIHPYMRGEVYVGTTFTAPTYHVDAPIAKPAVAGVGSVYYNAQWQDAAPGTKSPDPVDGIVKDGIVQVINAATWTVSNTIPVGNSPHNIWMGKGNTKALVTNWFDNTVSLIDTGTKTVIGEYIAGAAPAHVTSDFAGDNWYVSIEASDYVQSFKQSRMSMNGEATVSGYGPHGIWYGGGKLVTTNTLDNSYNIIDAGTMTDLGNVKIGLYPLGASVNSTGTIGAAGNYLASSVSIINITTRALIRNIPLPGNSVQVPFTPDDKYIVVPASPYTCVIDAAKAADPVGTPDPAAAVVACVWTGKGAHGAAFVPKSGGGLYAVVSHKYENYMSVLDISTPTNPASIVRSGDVPLVLTTTGKVAIVGATDTGGNAIASNPNPAPWQ